MLLQRLADEAVVLQERFATPEQAVEAVMNLRQV
jgi:hypothetical protein